jgi:hypothetical protein
MAARTTTGEIVAIKGGEFLIGSDDFYPEERPARRVRVESFAIDCYPVTNAEFARFVDATGYVTVAERPIDPAQYPGASPELCVPGSAVFRRARGPVNLADWAQWWALLESAQLPASGKTLRGQPTLLCLCRWCSAYRQRLRRSYRSGVKPGLLQTTKFTLVSIGPEYASSIV